MRTEKIALGASYFPSHIIRIIKVRRMRCVGGCNINRIDCNVLKVLRVRLL